MERQTIDLVKYCIVDASSMEHAAKSAVRKLVERYGSKMVDGCVICPHGESSVSFVEINFKEGPVVDMMVNIAERYSLYPFYIIEENKGHLPKQAKYQRYIVEEGTALFKKTRAGLPRFKELLAQACKKIYREESVFVKAFVYEGDRFFHVAMFNSERSPKSRDTIIGVPEWREAICKLVSDLSGSVTFKTVRYANL